MKSDITIYKVPELAEFLGVAPQTIRIYLKEGRLKGVKAGRQWVVTEESLKEFLDPNKKEKKE